MSLIAGWPVLSLLAVAAFAGACLSDSRAYFLVNRLALPVLCEGAILHCFYFAHV